MPRRPTAFIASAWSQLRFAKRVGIGLRRTLDCTIWSAGFYEPGHYVLDDLAAKGDRFDYAIFVAGPDDLVIGAADRQTRKPRDNVVFEWGYFTAKLGRDRCIIIVPPPGLGHVKLPSDASGLNVISVPAIRDLPNKLDELRAIIDTRGARIAQAIIPVLRETGIFPVFRDLDQHPDWFSEMIRFLDGDVDHLDSSMAYYGPGLAERWISQANESAAEKAQLAGFRQGVKKLFKQYQARRVTIVDLGVGDFRKGAEVLDLALGRPIGREFIRYFPMDISVAMLGLALTRSHGSPGQNTLKKVEKNRGAVVAINAPFNALPDYKPVFSSEDTVLFLLLGNSLGNFEDDVQLLRQLRHSMKPGDLLMLELQLTEAKSPSKQALNSDAESSKAFFAGPLIGLGAPDGNLVLTVEVRDVPAAAARVHLIHCSSKRKLTLNHPGLKRPRHFPPGQPRRIHIIRKYDSETIARVLFEEPGFAIVDQHETQLEKRRFGLFLLCVVS